MNRRVSIRLMVAVIGAAPFALFAAGPATRPADSPAPSALVAQPPSGNVDDATGRGRQGMRGMPVLTEEETAAAITFMSQHSSKRLAALEALPDTPRKAKIKSAAALAALQLMRLEKDDPKLYKVSLDRVVLEDELFGLLAELRRAPAEKQDSIKADLKSKVLLLVNAGLEERKIRLENLQATVAAEQTKLDNDRSNKEKLVDERYASILKDGGGLGASFKPAGPGGGNGGPGQHRGEKHQPGEGTPPQ